MTRDIGLCKNFNGGFTLAEVLITLGIIGVVAALTMPSLIAKHRIMQWETALKANYSLISNGFLKIMADTGCDNFECTGIFVNKGENTDNSILSSDPDFNNNIDAAVRKAFNVVETYKAGEYEQTDYKYLKGGSPVYPFEDFVMVLSNGAIVGISNKGCVETDYLKKCGWIFIDVNGKKGPNHIGKDAFGLGALYENGKLIPDASIGYIEAHPQNVSTYWRNNTTQCGKPDVKLKDDPTSTISGQNCLARIMENSWKMDYLD